jgi:PBP1b-binding outer membrane lipoprotein LpoB
MRWTALIVGVALLLSGCVSHSHNQTFSVTSQVRSMELRDLQTNPGIAECGCTYSVTW